MYFVNVSSVQEFYQCRFRWWCRWVMNRVPRADGPALDGGKMLHTTFERHFRDGYLLEDAAKQTRKEYDAARQTLSGPERTLADKAIQIIDDLEGCWHLWKDEFVFTEMLECEKPFEIVLPEYAPDITWRGRPDYMGVCLGRIWHRQNRGLAAGMNFGTYKELAKRHYHEHLYAEYAEVEYADREESYGGTMFNLVRKLKYRTNVGKKNEKIKTAKEMFFQHPMSVKLSSGQHKSVMQAMVGHVREMQRVINRWEEYNEIPSPNEKMNGGWGGNTLDPFFLVLTGKAKLDDDTLFKDRNDMYAAALVEE